jgi:hypothetical protein
VMATGIVPRYSTSMEASAVPAAARVPRVGEAARSTGGTAALVAGALLALVAAGIIAAGIGGVLVDGTERDGRGFLTSPATTVSTSTYAVVSDLTVAGARGPDWGSLVRDPLGDVEVRVGGTQPVFVGIGRVADVRAYLSGVAHERFDDLAGGPRVVVSGGERPSAPTGRTFWAATATGPGPHALRWQPRNGKWLAVVMAADGTRGVTADLALAAEVPDLLRVSAALTAGGALLLALGCALVASGARRRAGREALPTHLDA